MKIIRMYLGTKQISKIYHGLNLIWPAVSDGAYYGYVDDKFVLSQLAIMSSTTGETITIECEDVFMHDSEAFSGIAITPDLDAKDLFKIDNVTSYGYALKSYVLFNELFNNEGITPESKIGVDTLVIDDVLFNIKTEHTEADTSKPINGTDICFASNFDVTNTPILRAFVDTKEILRYKAHAHDYIESHGEIKYRLILVENVKGGTASLINTESGTSVVYVSDVKASYVTSQLASAATQKIFEYTADACTGFDIDAISNVDMLFAQHHIPKATVLTISYGQLYAYMFLKVLAEASEGSGNDAVSKLDLHSLYKAFAHSGNAAGSVGYSRLQMQSIEKAKAISVLLLFPNARLKQVFNWSVEADTLNIVEAICDTINISKIFARASIAIAQTINTNNRAVIIEQIEASIKDAIPVRLIEEIASVLEADATEAIGSTLTIEDKNAMVCRAIAESMFVWLYPVWLSSDHLFIRCGASIRQEGDTLFID